MFISNSTILSILIVIILVYYLEISTNVVILTLNMSSILAVISGGYYAYKNPVKTITAYKMFLSDINELINQFQARLVKQDFTEVTYNDVKIITTPSGTHIIPLDPLNYISHTLEMVNSGKASTIYIMAENCSYNLCPNNVDCQAIIARSNGVELRVKNNTVINLDKIRKKSLR